MALIQYGGGVTEMSGSIAGNVFSRNRFGAYARARTTPVNPNSSYQQVVRAALSQLTNRWSQNLTAAQRTAWDTYAASVQVLNRLGQPVYLTGFNHYIRSNVPVIQAGETIVDAGPTVLALPAQDPTFAVAASEAAGVIVITFDDADPWCDEDGAFLSLAMGRPQLATRNFFAGPFRAMAEINGDSVTPPTTGTTVSPAFTLIEGQKFWVRARIARADGRLSEFFRGSGVVAA